MALVGVGEKVTHKESSNRVDENAVMVEVTILLLITIFIALLTYHIYTEYGIPNTPIN